MAENQTEFILHKTFHHNSQTPWPLYHRVRMCLTHITYPSLVNYCPVITTRWMVALDACRHLDNALFKARQLAVTFIL